MKNRGRPNQEICRRKGYRLRMTGDEEEMLNYLSEETGLTKADIFRKSLKMFYNLEKSKH